jgi:GNAT superfamily N-acetyltransferase
VTDLPDSKPTLGVGSTRVREYRDTDWEALWAIIGPVFRAGETYAVPTDIDAVGAHRLWVDLPLRTFVAEGEAGQLMATYYIKSNQAGPGSHVCNCGYIVAPEARGQGLASALCLHSLEQAAQMGFRAMQYNLVVATNQAAIHIWRRHGFQEVGILPGAYRSASRGYVDALVMYRSLGDLTVGRRQAG